jgi:hypothetical protein
MINVEDYNNQHVLDEWNRHNRHHSDFPVTMRTLSELLPPPPQTIVDIGGDPGPYAMHRSKQGYHVTQADLSIASLNLALQSPVCRSVPGMDPARQRT